MFFLRENLFIFIAWLHDEKISLWAFIYLSSQANVTSHKSINLNYSHRKITYITLHKFSNIDKFFFSKILLYIVCNDKVFYLCVLMCFLKPLSQKSYSTLIAMIWVFNCMCSNAFLKTDFLQKSSCTLNARIFVFIEWLI